MPDTLTLGPIETIPHPQGSDEWMAERCKPMTCCASEAAAAMGVSPHMKRDELIAKMAMGHEKEFGDYVRKMILDRGHEHERSARELLEKDLGELAPLTLARVVQGMRWLASLDGQTMDERATFEHKDWNAEIVAAVRRGEVPIDKACQMEHQLIVSGSEYVRFVCSDGQAENWVELDYRSNPELRAKVVAAWEQVLKDVAAYTPAPPAPAAVVPKTIEALPALSFRVEGKLVGSNLADFKPQALAYIGAINTTLTDDQHFADAKADAKFCRDSADKLELVIEQALGQMGDINTAINTVRELADAFDKKGLQLEKLVESQEKAVKEAEITRGRTALQKHIADLNEQLGKAYMPAIAHDFVAAAKNVRTIESLRNRVNTHLAECKIAANERFGVINRNLTWLRENATEHADLFKHDTSVIVLKAHDDLVALATLRINEHKEKEEKRLATIRAEEAAKLQAAAAPAPTQAPAPAPAASPAIGSQAPAANSSFTAPAVVPMRAAAPASPPTLTLGALGDRLGFTVTAEFVGRMGLQGQKVRSAVLFHEHDYPKLLASIGAHLRMLEEQYSQKAA